MNQAIIPEIQITNATQTTTPLERFDSCMEYQANVPRPNHELGAWAQTRARWLKEAPAAVADFNWNWFSQEPGLALDRREFIPVNFGFQPPFERKVLEETDSYEIVRNAKGVVTKALKAGTLNGQRMCMDQHLRFPIESPKDFTAIKRRLEASLPRRYPKNLDELISKWNTRTHPLILGCNTAANGFYWRAREFMGTENLSLAWYDYPEMMHEMMEFFADFIIETARPVLDRIQIDYFTLNEDLSMKSGPLLSPKTFRTFIFPHLKRLVAFFKSKGTRYVAIDTDGDPTLLIPQFMEAGIDAIWPLERASNVDPQRWRKKFGKSLRMWGGVDKRILAKDKAGIKAHLKTFIPLIEEGGFIPTVDHTVPPDVSWENFRYYMDCKQALLRGDFGKLD